MSSTGQPRLTGVGRRAYPVSAELCRWREGGGKERERERERGEREGESAAMREAKRVALRNIRLQAHEQLGEFMPPHDESMEVIDLVSSSDDEDGPESQPDDGLAVELFGDEEDEGALECALCSVCLTACDTSLSCGAGHSTCPDCVSLYMREPSFSDSLRELACPGACGAALATIPEACKWVRSCRPTTFNGQRVDVDELIHGVYEQLMARKLQSAGVPGGDVSALSALLASLRAASIPRTPCCREPFAGVREGNCMKVMCDQHATCQSVAFCFWCHAVFDRHAVDPETGESIGHQHVRLCPDNPQPGTVFVPEGMTQEDVDAFMARRVREEIVKRCREFGSPSVVRRAAAAILEEHGVDVVPYL